MHPITMHACRYVCLTSTSSHLLLSKSVFPTCMAQGPRWSQNHRVGRAPWGLFSAERWLSLTWSFTVCSSLVWISNTLSTISVLYLLFSLYLFSPTHTNHDSSGKRQLRNNYSPTSSFLIPTAVFTLQKQQDVLC